MRVFDKAKTYGAYLPDQDFLLPPSLKDWLPEDRLADSFRMSSINWTFPRLSRARAEAEKEGEAAGTGQAGEKGSI